MGQTVRSHYSGVADIALAGEFGVGVPPTAEDPIKHHETRGRPRIRRDDEILEAALQGFAAQGFDAMSLRSLNSQLGLSHGTISQRFGTKQRLYFAAVDLGFAVFLADLGERRQMSLSAIDAPDDLADLRATIRAFLGAALLRPELGRLMNQEGLYSTVRLQYIVEHVMEPVIANLSPLLVRLNQAGRVRPVTARAVFFLVAHGAEAPFALTALSDAFDSVDGPLDPHQHADDVTDLLMRGITLDAGA
jgi:AcrR family transcriptional regulator